MKSFLSLVTFVLIFATHHVHAATYCVDDTSDGIANAADCASTCDGSNDCSLRDAVAAAEANVGADIIELYDVSGTITFTESATLSITEDLEIYGPSQDDLTIDADGVTTGVRIFTSDGANLVIASLTLTGGQSNYGGAVSATGGSLAINDATLIDNSSTDLGGGLGCETSCTLRGVTMTNNRAGNSGGGIFNEGILTLIASTLSGNTAQNGAAIYDDSGTSDNKIHTTTISGNSATQHGGGIYQLSGNYEISSTTITDNTADSDDNDDGNGGGIYITQDTVSARNTILAANHDESTNGVPTVHPDCSGPGTITSLGYNLVGNAEGCNGTAATGDLVGDSANPLDPRLSALADFGGVTSTHSLLPASPAIDAGNPAGCTDSDGELIEYDQRERTRQVDANGDGIARCDIGSYEIQLFTVDTHATTVFGDNNVGDEICLSASNGGCTLEAALQEANARNGTDAIDFSITGTTMLIDDLPDIIDNLIISGPGADILTIDANNRAQAFKVDSVTNDMGLALSGVTVMGAQLGLFIQSGDKLRMESVIIDGNSAGGINTSTNSDLYISDSAITNNTRANGGGGILFGSGDLTILRSLIANNATTSPSSGNGGGLALNSGDARIINSTISNNSAASFGGAISNANADIAIVNSTITGNRADSDNDASGTGGGISNGSGDISIKSSIISDNKRRTGVDEVADNCNSAMFSVGFNIEDGTDCSLAAANDLQNTDPLLGPLADNGGPTHTHALFDGSPAIDGVDGDCEDTEGINIINIDQRGFIRPVNADCDIGAFEVGVCGDGTLDAGEACDDGNIIEGDGCDAVCAIEVPIDNGGSGSGPGTNDEPNDESNNDSLDEESNNATDDTTDGGSSAPVSGGGCSLVRSATGS